MTNLTIDEQIEICNNVAFHEKAQWSWYREESMKNDERLHIRFHLFLNRYSLWIIFMISVFCILLGVFTSLTFLTVLWMCSALLWLLFAPFHIIVGKMYDSNHRKTFTQKARDYFWSECIRQGVDKEAVQGYKNTLRQNKAKLQDLNF